MIEFLDKLFTVRPDPYGDLIKKRSFCHKIPLGFGFFFLYCHKPNILFRETDYILKTRHWKILAFVLCIISFYFNKSQNERIILVKSHFTISEHGRYTTPQSQKFLCQIVAYKPFMKLPIACLNRIYYSTIFIEFCLPWA